MYLDFFFREIAASLYSCHFCCSIFLRSFYGFGIRKCICRRESMQSFVEIWNDDDAKSRLFCKTRPRNFKLKPHMCQLSCVFGCCFAEMRLRKLTLWQNYVRYRPEITYEFTAHFIKSRDFLFTYVTVRDVYEVTNSRKSKIAISLLGRCFSFTLFQFLLLAYI